MSAQSLPENRECDLVMKGGITSGIVYPPLVIKLHRDGYSFRSVGGTSAGAIAAATTAAAEYGKATGGFPKLEKVREWLGEDRNLLNLFQAPRRTAPLLRTFLIYPKLKWLRFALIKLPVALLAGDPLFFILGAALGAALSFLITWMVGGVFKSTGFVIFLVLLALVFALLMVGLHLYFVLTGSVRRNFFGICTGRGARVDKMDETALTDWLTAQLNDMAGKEKDGPPLTFGELWAQGGPQDKRRIDLRMITSNLSQNRPYILPFDDVYLFREDEFEKLFPLNVVRHMKERQRVVTGFIPPEGYFLLPEAKDLPVVVATRMSLSFPVLISMIPLYTISRSAFKTKVRFDLEVGPEHYPRIVLKEMTSDGRWVEASGTFTISDPLKNLQRNWFSDGGICSNFPIHFFDAWLPTRPTFGVNLTTQMGEQENAAGGRATGKAAAVKAADPHRFSYVAQQPTPAGATARPRVLYDTDVYLPQPGSEAVPEWTPIQSVVKFLGSIFRTAQNYRDNMQAMLPSYYERIVQIRLSDNEGGLNLEMPPEAIAEVVKKGEDAGELLITEFDMAKHQWVRFRVLMGQLEKELKRMNDAIVPKGTFDYPALMTDQLNPSEGFPYVRVKEWCDNATSRLKKMNEVIAGWRPPDLAEDPPLPEPVLRVAPEV